MKRYLLLLLCFLSSYSFGQQFYSGISLGGIRSETIRTDFEYYKPLYSWTINPFIEWQKNHFFLKGTVGLTNKGYSQELQFIDSLGGVVAEGAVENTRHLYFESSVLAGLSFGERFVFRIATGVSPSFYFSTNVKMANAFDLGDGTSIAPYSMYFDYLESFDLASSSEVSFGYKIDDQSTFLLFCGFQQGLRNIGFKDLPTEQRWRNRSFVLQLGVKHAFMGKQSSAKSDKEKP
jgi:hypothetical protein